MENARNTTSHNDPDEPIKPDYRKGHIPSFGLARVLLDLDIEEWDRKIEQQQARRQEGKR